MNKNDFITIASPNQFEIKIPYHSDSDIKKIDYDTSIYIFIPKNLNINPSTYSNNSFFNDYISYIRFITPQNKLGVLQKRFATLIKSLERNEHDENSINYFKKEMRLIVCSYVSYLSNYSKSFALKSIHIKQLNIFLCRIKNFQELINTMLVSASNTKNNDIIDFTLSTSEYLSYATQNCLLEINVHLKAYEEKYSDTINEIIKIINTIIEFCKENDFPVISNDTYQNEKVIYRYSILKKYFYGILYLYQKKKRDGGGIKEIYYAIAAGISMVFTTLIVFATQKEYGNFTTSFFIALVISYMLKDRIKEAHKNYFDKRLAIKTYDYKEKIYSSDKKLIFAFIKEKMQFIRREKLEDDIAKTRLLEVPRRLSSYLEEDIIKFEKRTTVHNRNIQRKYDNTIHGIHNIMRFDISQYLKRMDATKVPLYRVNDDKLFGNKVYHVNIIMKHKSENGIDLYRARIIINKRGIKRIELPESGLRIFPKESLASKKNWFSFKKSGLIKKSSQNRDKIKTNPDTPNQEI